MLYFWKKQTRQLLKQFFVTFFHFRILQIFNNKCTVKNLKYYIYLPNEKCKKNYLFVNILSVHPGFLKCDYTLHACWWYYPASYLFVFRPKILTFLQLAGWSHVTSKKSVTWHLFLSTAHRFEFNPKSNRFYGKGFCVDFDLLLLILKLTKFLIFSNGWVSELFWMYNCGFFQSKKADLCIVNFYFFWKKVKLCKLISRHTTTILSIVMRHYIELI